MTLTLHQFSIPQFTSVGLSRQCSRKIFDKFYLKSKSENSFLIKEVSQRSLSGCLDKLTMDKLTVNCKELRPFQPITDHLKCQVYEESFRRPAVKGELNRLNIDIAALQETRLTADGTHGVNGLHLFRKGDPIAFKGVCYAFKTICCRCSAFQPLLES